MDFQDALGLHRQGHAEEAARAYERLLQIDPTHHQALIHLGALRLSQGQAQVAESLLRHALAVAPDAAEALGNLAAALQAQSRFEEAIEQYELALKRRPDLLDARFGLAACLQARGQHEAAIENFQTILAAVPTHPEAQYGLASVLVNVGRTEEAMAAFRSALTVDPDFAEASFGLGKLLARNQKLSEAIACYRQALAVDPEYVEARAALGVALSRLDRDQEALQEFRAVLALDVGNAEAHAGIAMLLERNLQHEEALAHYRTALCTNPEHPDAMAGMAEVLKNTGQHQEALALARRVVAQRPHYAAAVSLLGVILAELGEIDEAVGELRRAAALAAHRPDILYHLAELSTVKRGDGTLEALEALVSRVDTFPARGQCLLYFALAKACVDVGEHKRGFVYLQRGNSIKRSQICYLEATVLNGMARIAEVFTPSLLSMRQGMGDPSALPVFVVGMPRSGSTLVEQILASHPQVFGAGERTELAHTVRRLMPKSTRMNGFPEIVSTLSNETLRCLGGDYVAVLHSLAPEAARVVDKMPSNFLYLGLIRLLLPNAYIVHVRRDPVDTCLSCFSKLFTGFQPFAYDLAELGRYYRAYEDLMAHWRRVIPSNILLEVEYETLIKDFEAQARRLVVHCGLPWDAACLEFHKTSRAVHTASVLQVRQPIYRAAIGRWRPDAALLQRLLDALAGH